MEAAGPRLLEYFTIKCATKESRALASTAIDTPSARDPKEEPRASARAALPWNNLTTECFTAVPPYDGPLGPSVEHSRNALAIRHAPYVMQRASKRAPGPASRLVSSRSSCRGAPTPRLHHTTPKPLRKPAVCRASRTHHLSPRPRVDTPVRATCVSRRYPFDFYRPLRSSAGPSLTVGALIAYLPQPGLTT